jgi:hypothetical protein
MSDDGDTGRQPPGSEESSQIDISMTWCTGNSLATFLVHYPHSYSTDQETVMRAIIGWGVGATCATLIVTGLSAAPAPAQETKNDRREVRHDSREVRADRREVAKDTQEVRSDRRELEASRQKLRDAYKSGDPAAIKAAREGYQKSRGSYHADAKDRRQDVRNLQQDRQDRRQDIHDLHEDAGQARIHQSR